MVGSWRTNGRDSRRPIRCRTLRPTTDGDIVVDVRAFGRQAMTEIADALLTLGFAVEISPEGVTRFSALLQRLISSPRKVLVHVLTSPPGHAVQAPGTTQALERSEYLTVRVDDAEFEIRSPSLLRRNHRQGSSIRNSWNQGRAPRHQQDLAFLLSLAAEARFDNSPSRSQARTSRLQSAVKVGSMMTSTGHGSK